MSDGPARGLTTEARLHFRDQLREARAAALRDAEGFQEILFAFERLGSHLWYQNPPKKRKKHPTGLDDYKEHILSIAGEVLHDRFDLIRAGRNDALHRGAVARNLTANLVELSLLVEEGLMSGNNQVKHFMVKNPVCAQLWQSLSLIRETMLANQFTYLPVFVKEGGKSWQLVSDFKLAQYLRSGNPSSTEKKNRLARRLEEAAHGSGALELLLAGTVTENDSIEVALSRSEGRPVVVSTGESEFSEHLMGILTPFDVL